MAANEYIQSAVNRVARPRSERLRSLGMSSAGPSISAGAGNYSGIGDGHIHHNLADLNRLSVNEGYLYLTDESIDPSSGSVIQETIKSKAGYSDRAFSNAAGHELNWFLPEEVGGVLTLKLNPIYAGLWANGWISGGGIGEDGEGGGGGLITSVRGVVNLGTPIATESLTETFSAKAIESIYEAVVALQNSTPNVSLTNGGSYSTLSVNGASADFYTVAQVNSLIGAINNFHYEIYASTSAVTSPSANVLYLIGPTGTGADKYEEYVYDSTKQDPWVKIGDTSIDLSGYATQNWVQQQNYVTGSLVDNTDYSTLTVGNSSIDLYSTDQVDDLLLTLALLNGELTEPFSMSLLTLYSPGNGGPSTQGLWANGDLTLNSSKKLQVTYKETVQSLVGYSTNTITKTVAYTDDIPTIYSLTLSAGAFTAGTYNPKTSSGNSFNIPTTLDHIADGNDRKLTNYLLLTGGTLTGALTGTSASFTSLSVGGNSVTPSNYVTLDGPQDISGAKTFKTNNLTLSGIDLLPKTHDTCRIGTSSARIGEANIRNLYTTNLQFRDGDTPSTILGVLYFGSGVASIKIGSGDNQVQYVFNATYGFFHGGNGAVPCGRNDHRWSNVFSVDANISGKLSLGVLNGDVYSEYGEILAPGGYVALLTRENTAHTYKQITFHERYGFYPETSGIDLGYNSASHRWANIYGVNANLSGNLDLAATSHIDFGTARVDYDSDNEAIRVRENLCATGWVASGGIGSADEDTAYYDVTLDAAGHVESYDPALDYDAVLAKLDVPGVTDVLRVKWQRGSNQYTEFLAPVIGNGGPNGNDLLFGSCVFHYNGTSFDQYYVTFLLEKSGSTNTLIAVPITKWELQQARVNSIVANATATDKYPSTKAVYDEFQRKPVTVWETSGTGLTARKTNMSANPEWQLTGLDMSPYKRVKIYTKAAQKSGTTASASTTPAIILEMLLDSRAAGPYGDHYIGSTMVQKPNDNNRLATLTCAISADKTSFVVLWMTNLYGTAATDNSDVGGYVFKIEGYYD